MNSNAYATRQQSTEEINSSKARQNNNAVPLPNALRANIECRAGIPMDDVSVHYNSPDPLQWDALAFAAGSNIYLGPGQEKHLPHEAWHVVQQKLGRVRPTGEVNGRPVNDNPYLEAEASNWRLQETSSIEPSDFLGTGVQSDSEVIQRIRLRNASNNYQVNVPENAIAHALNQRVLEVLSAEGPKPWLERESPSSLNWEGPTRRSVSTLPDYYQLLKELKLTPSFYFDLEGSEGVQSQIISSPLGGTTDIAKFKKPAYVDNRSIGVTTTEKIDPTYVEIERLFGELGDIEDGTATPIGEHQVAQILLDLLNGNQPNDYLTYFSFGEKVKARTILSLLLESEPLRFGGIFAYAPLLLHAIAGGQINAAEAFDAQGEKTPTKTPSLWPPAYVGSRQDLRDLEEESEKGLDYSSSFPATGQARRKAFIAKMGYLVKVYLGDSVNFSVPPKNTIPGSDFSDLDGAITAAVNLIVDELLGSIPAFQSPVRDSPETATRRSQETHNSLLYEFKDKAIDILGSPLENDPLKPKLKRRRSVENLAGYLVEGQEDRRLVEQKPSKKRVVKQSRKSALSLKRSLIDKDAAAEDSESEDEFEKKIEKVVEEQDERHKRRRLEGWQPDQHRQFDLGFDTGINAGPTQAKGSHKKQFITGRTEGKNRRAALVAQGEADAVLFLNSQAVPKIPTNPVEAAVWLRAYSERLSKGV